MHAQGFPAPTAHRRGQRANLSRNVAARDEGRRPVPFGQRGQRRPVFMDRSPSVIS